MYVPQTGMVRLGRSPGLGDASLSTFLQDITRTGTNDLNNWLIQQYAMLQALPVQMTALANLGSKLASTLAAAPDQSLQSTLQAANTQLATLQAQYPSMIAAVNNAYLRIQALQTPGNADVLTTVTAGVDTASAITAAQDFTTKLGNVKSGILQVGTGLVASGALSSAGWTAMQWEAQGSSLLGSSAGTIGLVAALALGAFVFLRRR